MKGMARLVSLRMSGKAPAMVIVEVCNAPRPMDDESLAILVRPTDDLSDLRALFGLSVLVTGWDDRDAVLRFCRAATQAQASEVVGFYGDGIRAGRMESDEVVYAS